MNKTKIFNDPIYGLISFDSEILYDLINHPYFQRLRRISQMGLSQYVYPGAVHTRFHHVIGALHLMSRALKVLSRKGVEISDEESKAVRIAILLHDIGHGPFSHALEKLIVPFHHEDISLAIMTKLNEEFNGDLDLAISIFKGEYRRPFFHELVSGQLDMDRMDFLNRDSYYTGVSEGIVGYDRIIEMLNVKNNHLVVEEKAIYSIEKYLVARRIMYWQVYLHKVGIVVENMLRQLVSVLREDWHTDDALRPILEQSNFIKLLTGNDLKLEDTLSLYLQLDDTDVIQCMKTLRNHSSFLLSYLSNAILDRQLFKIELSKTPIKGDREIDLRLKISSKLSLPGDIAEKLILKGSESNQAYNDAEKEIIILEKTGAIRRFSEVTDHAIDRNVIVKHFLCYPKLLC